MRRISGDLIQYVKDGHCDVIVHGCNCQNTMGRGIAAQIKSEFPEAYEADLRTTKNSRFKLGTISSAASFRDDESCFYIVNAYTQFHWRGAERKTDYDAILSCFELVKKQYGDMRIAYPKIGCGLGGGDWSIVEPIIDYVLKGLDHVLVEKG